MKSFKNRTCSHICYDDITIYFKMLTLTFSSKLDWASYIVSIAKTAPKKIGALIFSVKFFPLSMFSIFVNLPCGRAWNTVVMSGLVLLAATWNC